MVGEIDDYLIDFSDALIESYSLKFPGLKIDRQKIKNNAELKEGTLWYDLNRVGFMNEEQCMDETLWPVKNNTKANDHIYPY